MHIRKMQTCGRLIQNVDSLTCAALAQLCGKLDPLCLSSGKLCGRLSQPDIGKSYIIKSLYLSFNRRNILKKVSASSTVIFSTS